MNIFYFNKLIIKLKKELKYENVIWRQRLKNQE